MYRDCSLQLLTMAMRDDRQYRDWLAGGAPEPTYFERNTSSISVAAVFQPSFWLNIARCFHNQTTESVFGSI